MCWQRVRLIKLQHGADNLIEVVKAETTSGDSIGIKPLRKKRWTGSLLDFCANELAKLIVHRFEVRAKRNETGHILLIHERRIHCRWRTLSEQDIKAVEEFEALAELRRLE